MSIVETSAIVKTPGVCGGDARVGGTRIPVWLLVLKRKWGESEERTLASYPTLKPADLDAVWDYYGANPLEVEQTIWLADIATNVPDGTPPPTWVLVAGRLLGLSEEVIRQQFDPPASPERLAAAWQEYRTDPAGVLREIAHYRQPG
jgi:uncharacterized protein (DUF433 family)